MFLSPSAPSPFQVSQRVLHQSWDPRRNGGNTCIESFVGSRNEFFGTHLKDGRFCVSQVRIVLELESFWKITENASDSEAGEGREVDKKKRKYVDGQILNMLSDPILG